MKYRYWFWIGVFVLALILLWGLSPARKAKQILAHSIQSCGGWKVWQKKQAIQFVQTLIFYNADGVVTDKKISMHRFPLHSKALIRIESIGDPTQKIIQGYDGRHAWVLMNGAPSQDPMQISMAKFATLTSYYWLGLPFKLRDSGTILRYQGKTPPDEQGRVFDKVRVTYRRGTGESPEDWYVYYFDSKRGFVGKALFEITAEPFKGNIEMAEWLDYQDVDGIEIATRRVFYPADEKGNILGPKTMEELIEEIEFRPHFSNALFEAPKRP